MDPIPNDTIAAAPRGEIKIILPQGTFLIPVSRITEVTTRGKTPGTRIALRNGRYFLLACDLATVRAAIDEAGQS